jgi:3-deoxy-D-manno-octulosonate 8-phosphate phosphatase (KDO 8-P phosphatase)
MARSDKPRPRDLDPERLAQIDLVILDCDGVLTDGRVWVDASGNETKAFSVIDGQGLVMVREEGVRLAMVTTDRSGIPLARATKLGFEFIRTHIEDKRTTVRQILAESGVSPERAIFMGDDLPDLPAFEEVGLAVAPSTARPEVVAAAEAVTVGEAGAGAVRELCDAIRAARAMHRRQ